MPNQSAPEFPLGNDKYLVIKDGRAVVEVLDRSDQDDKNQSEMFEIDAELAHELSRIKKEEPEQKTDVGGGYYDFYDEAEFDLYDVDLTQPLPKHTDSLTSDESTGQDH